MNSSVIRMLSRLGVGVLIAGIGPIAYAQEVGHYLYDVHGRLQASVRAPETGGSVARYALDGADNRTSRQGANVPVRSPAHELQSNQFIVTSQFIRSADGRFRLHVQTDGNVVLYGPSGAMWVTPNTWGRQSTTLTMQADGNLSVRGPAGEQLWHSGTGGNPGARFVVQDDGNLVIYVGGTPIWASGTYHP